MSLLPDIKNRTRSGARRGCRSCRGRVFQVLDRTDDTVTLACVDCSQVQQRQELASVAE